MDYTPGIFDTKLSSCQATTVCTYNFGKTVGTLCNDVQSLQMAADLPESYERHMDAFQFIKDVVVDWDDSKYLKRNWRLYYRST